MKWQHWEINLLRQRKLSAEKLEKILNRSKNTINKKCQSLKISAKIKPEYRFWQKVNKYTTIYGDSGQYPTICWEWCASLKNHYGYGGFRDNGRVILAHRYSWELTYGLIPDNLCVLHKCDNPKCVRPCHLFLGTISDNSIDMFEKNRGNNVLQSKDIIRIRKLYRTGKWTQKELANKYGVARGTVSDIVTKKTWSRI